MEFEFEESVHLNDGMKTMDLQAQGVDVTVGQGNGNNSPPQLFLRQEEATADDKLLGFDAGDTNKFWYAIY